MYGYMEVVCLILFLLLSMFTYMYLLSFDIHSIEKVCAVNIRLSISIYLNIHWYNPLLLETAGYSDM